jgi:DNA uptake protein ComE-like DNA-binding protein
VVLTLERRSASTPLGQVLQLPCKFIQGTSSIEPMAIDAISRQLADTGKNVLPVMVKPLKKDKYEVVLNSQILVAAKQAKLDFIYCIVVDEEMAAQLKIETGKLIKVNLNLATESELTSAFTNIKTNLTGFDKIEPAVIAKSIIAYRSSDRIKSLNFLTKLKCGIGKAKLSGLIDRLVY